MRFQTILFGALVAISTPALAYSEADLLAVADHPDLQGYAQKVHDALEKGGRPCRSVVKLNAFVHDEETMLVVAHCEGGEKYEALWNGTPLSVKRIY